MATDPRWYDGFFEGEWLDLVAPTQDERAGDQVDLIVERLGLAPGARVLDVPCGWGRHTLELARRGFRVTGVDLSPASLERARVAAGGEGLEVELVELDMRELPWEAEFEAVLNLWSSFGYFETDAENERALAAMARALVPGGALLLDTINPPGLFRAFRAQTWQEVSGGALMLEERRYVLETGRIETTWTFVRPDGERSELRFSLRQYTVAELAAMFTRVGLVLEATLGGWDGSELTLDSFRALLVGRRAQPSG